MSAAESFAGHGPGDVRGRGVGAERLGRDLRGDEPGHGRGHRRRSRRAIATTPRPPSPPRSRPSPGGPRRPPSTAPPRCTAVGDACEAAATSSPARSRSTRASRCTRSPTTRSTSCWPCWRGGRRGRHAPGGLDPAELVLAGQARAAHAPPAGAVAVVTPVELALHDARRDRRARAGGGNTVVWTPAPCTAVCSALLAECIARGRPPARRLQLRHRARRRSSATSSSPTRATVAVAFIGSTATGRRVAERAAGKARCSRWAATARSS